MKVLILSTRSPFELFMLFASVLSGVNGLFNPIRASASASSVLPEWELYTWYSTLLVGGIIALIGYARKTLFSLSVERTGLILLAAMSLVYSVTLLVNDLALAFAASFVIAFGVACVFRIRQIGAELKRVQEVVDSA